MATFPIPSAALDDRLAFVGTSGSGKTYAAGTAVERLLGTGARIVIIDPLDVWWGLRLRDDGKSAGIDVAIFGGAHGDLPLNEHAGKIIGETVAGMAESCIISLSELGTKAAERRFMLAFLEAVYRRASGEPFHLIFDEADLWAPQKTAEPALQSRMEQIVRRGRVRGFIPWLITQRPAILSKDVLSQADGLIAMKLTSSQDRDALGSWIEGQADRDEGKRLLATMPTLQRGEGLVWIPARRVLTQATFPIKATFDSSRTPARGEKKIARTLQPLDLGALKSKLATIEDESKANDPKALKARIAELERQAKTTSPDPKAIEVAESRAYKTGFAEGYAQGRADVVFSVERTLKDIPIPAGSPAPAPIPEVDAKAPRGTTGHRSAGPKPAAVARAAGISLGAERRPLGVLASAYPGGMTEAQWAVAAGMKRSGGTWGTYKSRLRTAGAIEERGATWFASETGLALVGADIPPMPAPGHELVEFWATRIEGGGRMLREIARAYPRSLTREELADHLGMTASGGTFGTYLSRLRTPGLIETSGGEIRATEALMGPPSPRSISGRAG